MPKIDGRERGKRWTSPAEELRDLIALVRTCAQSAENTALRCDREALAASEHAHEWPPIARPVETMKREITRMRRMLVAWEAVGLKDGSDHDARMHFTAGVEFFATVTRKSDETGAPVAPAARRKILHHRATMLIAKLQELAPLAAKRLDVALVARAIDRRSRGRWDWKGMVSAWGRSDMDPGSWRVRWSEWRKQKAAAPNVN